MKKFWPILVLVLALAAGGAWWFLQGGGGVGTGAGAGSLESPSDNDWPMARRTYAGWGHSPLKQITPQNVGELQFIWSTVVQAGPIQITPVVSQGVLYLLQPGDVIEAFEAKEGDRLWIYSRELPKDVYAVQRTLQAMPRALAVADGKVIHATADGYVLALEAATGKLLWEQQVGDYNQITQVSAPLVVGDKVITGRACEPALPDPCFIVAHNLKDGSEVWRRVLVPQEGEPGAETWSSRPADQRQQRGAWLTGTYDPELKLTFWGTGGALPLGGDAAGGLALTQSTLALNPDTGEVVWSRQHLPGDALGMDYAYERLVISTEVAPDTAEVPWVGGSAAEGGTRTVLSGVPGTDGLVWTLDAATGDFLWARPTVKQNLIAQIDASGQVSPGAGLTEAGQVCPSWLGGKNWASAAYNPDNNQIFVPLANACMQTGGERSLQAASENPLQLGMLQAISAATGQVIWKVTQPAPFSSLLSTGSGLLFAGDYDRRFRAYDQATGEVVWQTVMTGPVTGTPVAYAVDGQQFIAIVAGGGTENEQLLTLNPDLRPGSGGHALFIYGLPTQE